VQWKFKENVIDEVTLGKLINNLSIIGSTCHIPYWYGRTGCLYTSSFYCLLSSVIL